MAITSKSYTAVGQPNDTQKAHPLKRAGKWFGGAGASSGEWLNRTKKVFSARTPKELSRRKFKGEWSRRDKELVGASNRIKQRGQAIRNRQARQLRTMRAQVGVGGRAKASFGGMHDRCSPTVAKPR